MLSKLVSVALFSTVLSVAEVQAQSLAQLSGPSNFPPAGFSGQQFVDGRGCVFLRAGLGKSVNWVPRIDRTRKPLCGFPPTFGAQVAAAVAADMAPDPAAKPAVQAAAPTALALNTTSRPAVAAQAAPSPAPAPALFANAAKPAPPVRAPLAVATAAAPSPSPAPTVFAPRVASAAPAAQASRPGFGFLALFTGGRRAPQAPQGAAAPPEASVAVAATNLAPTYQTAAATGALSGGQVRCFQSAPQLERVQLRNGGSAYVCTRGDGTTDGWRPPIFVQGNGIGVALDNPALNAQTMAGAVVVFNGYAAPQPPQARVAYAAPVPLAPAQLVPVQLAPVIVVTAPQATARVASNAIPTPPPGYKLAWKDGRLNPLRGVGTAQGQAAQDQVWTRTVPAVLVGSAPPKATLARVLGLNTSVSTMSAPQTTAPASAAAKPAVASGTLFVQVGTFGQPANAQGAKARLAALGLPVSTSAITRKGKPLQIVYAGPFASINAAQAALQTVHGAGFADAILR